MILAYKFVTFPTPSVLQSHFSAAFHQYFGGEFVIQGRGLQCRSVDILSNRTASKGRRESQSVGTVKILRKPVIVKSEFSLFSFTAIDAFLIDPGG